jgi:pectate lyase
MKHPNRQAALALLAAVLCAATGVHGATVDAARATAPLDGWASQAGGTSGGANAPLEQIYTVTNRAQLLAAIANGGTAPKIIKLAGTVDMTEGKPYTSTADQSARGAIRLKSNTTLIGDGSGSGLVNGHVILSGVSQVIIRNLKIVNPCDVEPVWDPTDGATGNWNAAYDAIGISGSDHIWIDHNSFTDAPLTDNFAPIENGHVKQCHDGAVDVSNASDYVTLSYNVFGEHDKNNLIGSSSSAPGTKASCASPSATTCSATSSRARRGCATARSTSSTTTTWAASRRQATRTATASGRARTRSCCRTRTYSRLPALPAATPSSRTRATPPPALSGTAARC